MGSSSSTSRFANCFRSSSSSKKKRDRERFIVLLDDEDDEVQVDPELRIIALEAQVQRIQQSIDREIANHKAVRPNPAYPSQPQKARTVLHEKRIAMGQMRILCLEALSASLAISQEQASDLPIVTGAMDAMRQIKERIPNAADLDETFAVYQRTLRDMATFARQMQKLGDPDFNFAGQSDPAEDLEMLDQLYEPSGGTGGLKFPAVPPPSPLPRPIPKKAAVATASPLMTQ